MTYDVVVTASARRALQRLPAAPASAVRELLAGDLARHPYRLGRPLRLQLTGLYSARRGEYRILYSVDDARRTITVRDVAHRRHMYR